MTVDAQLYKEQNLRRTLAKMPEVQVLPHPPHSPDVAPSDYGRFRGMQSKLKDYHFRDRDEVFE